MKTAYNSRSTSALVAPPCPSPHAAIGGRERMATYKPIPSFDAHAQDAFWERAGMPDEKSRCWLWTGSRWRDGYGQWRGFAAHRIAYTFAVGPIANDLTVDHRCGNRACVNPAHLELVTASENRRRGIASPAKTKYPARKRTAARYGRRRERGHCVQCNTPSTKYRCDRCREIHNARNKNRKR